MSLEELVSSYGYWAIGVGTFLEGETILILGGFSAHRGFLELPWVIVCAFLGSFFGSQLYFHIGRTSGEKWLNKRPHWKARSEKVLSMLDKHQIWLILGYQFLYGVRSVTPFLIGAAKISPLRFFLLSMVGTFVWAVVVANLGYFFGFAIESIIGDIKRFELRIFGILAGIGLCYWLGHLIARKRKDG